MSRPAGTSPELLMMEGRLRSRPARLSILLARILFWGLLTLAIVLTIWAVGFGPLAWGHHQQWGPPHFGN